MNPVVSLRGLSVRLPKGADRPYALRDLSLDLNAGEILCVVGESGSGKSMTAGAIMGLLGDETPVSAGQIMFEGRDLLKLPKTELRRIRGNRISMIFQEPMTALNPLQPIGEQIAEMFRAHRRLSGREVTARVQKLLEDVQIPDPPQAARAYPHEISGGQRQRAMIAMALALDPTVLIADEPTTALDVTTQGQILRLISTLQSRKGTAVLFITHDFGVVAEIADRVAVMKHGVLVEQGSAAQILARPGHAYTQALVRSVPSLEPPRRSRPRSSVILSISNLSKTYRSSRFPGFRPRTTYALKDIDLTLTQGATLGIVGESGSGKSTLARCICDLIVPDAGLIRIERDQPQAARQDRAERRPDRQLSRARDIQMVFQDPYSSLNPRHRVGELAAEGLLLQGVSKTQALERVRELFGLVGLDPAAANRYPHEFSGGQRQRIGIARALALNPRILVADEPVSALDVTVQAQLLALFAELRDRLGLSILFITHDLRVAAQVCDEIVVMQKGKIVEQGETYSVFKNPQHPYTSSLLDSVPGKNWKLHPPPAAE